MSFAIQIDEPLASLLEELPLQAQASLRAQLLRIAEAAEHWPPEDPRWEEVAHLDGEGLLTYAAGCCLRLQLLADSRRVVVRQIGRVRVLLPASLPLA